MVHTSGAGGGEEPGSVQVLGVFPDRQVRRLLWDGDLPDGVLSFGAGHDQLVVLVFGGLLADEDGFLGDIQARPPQGCQLAFSNSTDRLRIEHILYCPVRGAVEGRILGLADSWDHSRFATVYSPERETAGCRLQQLFLPAPVRRLQKHLSRFPSPGAPVLFTAAQILNIFCSEGKC